MSGPTVVAIVFLLAIGASSFAWAGPGAFFAFPVTVIIVGVMLFLNVARGKKQNQQIQEMREEASTGKVEFSERDKETLTSE